MARHHDSVPLRIAAIYAAVAGAWILFSDRFLEMMTGDGRSLTRLQTYKGWFFVTVTAFLLFWLIRRYTAALSRSEEELRTRNEELTMVEEELRQQLDEYYKGQLELFEANQTLNALFHASPLGIVALDRSGTVTMWNRTAEKLFGWHEEEVVGRSYPLTSPDDRTEVRRFIEQTLRGEPIHDFEARRQKKNGEPLDVSISTAPLHGPTGEASGLIVMFTDITGRKLAAAEARRSHEQYEGLVNSIDGIVWELDVPSFRFTFVSRRAESLLGYPVENWLELPTFWQEHIHPDDRDWALLYCRTATDEKRDHDFEYRFLAADGRAVWLRDIVTVVVEDERPIKLRGVMFDITERRRAEEEVLRLNAELELRVQERTAELEAANRELESFSYSVSHDLRAPLRHIDGFSKALLDDYADVLDLQAKGYLNRVRGAAQRMGHLIDDMLQLADVSRSEVERRPVNLSSLAQVIVLGLKQTQPDRSVTFRIAEGIKAVGDPRLLRIVLENLLGNAWKYTGRREGAVIEFGASETDGMPIYFVRDNGVGFDMAFADKLFKPFQRLHATDEFEGTGIGLATVHRVISRHGGRVWVEAGEGKGAVFFFTLW